MKKSIYSLLFACAVIVSLTACKKEESVSPRQSATAKSTIDGKWSLVRIYGGIMGADENHAAGEIQWTFNSSNSTLTVNNGAANSTYYYLPSGNYSFQEVSNSGQNFLVIDGNELGEFVITGSQMMLDENKKSTGEGACGFYMVLER